MSTPMNRVDRGGPPRIHAHATQASAAVFVSAGFEEQDQHGSIAAAAGASRRSDRTGEQRQRRGEGSSAEVTPQQSCP